MLSFFTRIEDMGKGHKAGVMKAAVLLLLLLLLLLILPFVSSSMRSSYLYLLLNILILSLGIEAGFLAAISGHGNETKPSVEATNDALPRTEGEVAVGKEVVVKKAAMAKKMAASAAMVVNKVRKCPSVPSLFFIGSYETELEEEEEEQEEEMVPGVLRDQPTGQELFAKAEEFIGNFYKQLKMQREQSWKRIHGLYHRAFELRTKLEN